MGNQEDCITEVRMRENPIDKGGLQENLEGEGEIGFERRKEDGVGVPLQEVQINSTNLRSMAGDGGDVILSKKENIRNSEGGKGGARKSVKRKLYSEEGNGPKILE